MEREALPQRTSNRRRERRPAGRCRRAAPALALLAAVILACQQGHCAKLDAGRSELLMKLSHYPQLMCLDYLQYLLGRPANERSQRALASKSYYWYGGDGALRYELHQTESLPGRVVESTFVMHMLDADMTFADLNGAFGAAARRFYDYHSYPCELYSFTPDTNLVFSSPRNTFRVAEARVSYRGEPLPAPQRVHVERARAEHISRCSLAVHEERWDEARTLLALRLKEHPEDGEAHFLMGRTMAATGHLNEAIGQYKAALGLSEGKDWLKSKCLLALAQIRAVPLPPDRQVYRPIQVTGNGQRLSAGKEEAGRAVHSLESGARP